jgi:hypothetical protein
MELHSPSLPVAPRQLTQRNLTIPVQVASVLLLLAGIVAVYWPSLLGLSQSASAAGELAYVADLDFWKQTPRTAIVEANTHFDLNHDLNETPLQAGDWVGEVRPETNQEVMILLEPEQYVQRLYKNSQGQYIWLSMIGGRSSQPFHAPDICYDADGWQYNLGSYATPLTQGGEIYGLYLEAQKQTPNSGEKLEHVVYYFYLFPDDQRRLSDGIVLFKLTSGRYGSLEETLALHADFVRQFFDSAQ